MGTTVYHSGTLAAAREAALVGLPAIAVSLRGDDAAGYASAAAYVRDLVAQLRARRLLAPGFFLNVNVPECAPKGVRITRLSMTPRPERFERRTSPGGRLYFWPVWEQLKDDREGTDVWALVRATPLRLDVGDTDALAALRGLEVEGTPGVAMRDGRPRGADVNARTSPEAGARERSGTSEISMEVVAGFVGTRQDPEQFTVRPQIGWAVREVAGARRVRLRQAENISCSASSTAVMVAGASRPSRLTRRSRSTVRS